MKPFQFDTRAKTGANFRDKTQANKKSIETPPTNLLTCPTTFPEPAAARWRRGREEEAAAPAGDRPAAQVGAALRRTHRALLLLRLLRGQGRPRWVGATPVIGPWEMEWRFTLPPSGHHKRKRTVVVAPLQTLFSLGSFHMCSHASCQQTDVKITSPLNYIH